MWAQIAVAAVLMPAVWYAGVPRLPRWPAYLFGVATLRLVLALVFGGVVALHLQRRLTRPISELLEMVARSPEGDPGALLLSDAGTQRGLALGAGRLARAAGEGDQQQEQGRYSHDGPSASSIAEMSV